MPYILIVTTYGLLCAPPLPCSGAVSSPCCYDYMSANMSVVYSNQNLNTVGVKPFSV